jgi:ketosteroid isomerase-like protein
MGEHPNAEVYRLAMERFMAGDPAAADLISDDVVWWQIGSPQPLRGKQAVLADESTAGMEFEVAIHDITASDDHVVGLLTAHVKRGDEEFTYRSAEILHVEDGKISERWAFSDDTEAINRFFSG